MKKFCEYWREHAIKINNHNIEKQEYKSYLNQTNYHICQKMFYHRYTNDKKYLTVRGATYSIYNLKLSIPKEISVVFRNG